MSQKLTLLAVLTLAGCQTYDFEPVSPLALAQTTQKGPVVGHLLKPNVMLLVDISGSMREPLNPAEPTCGGCMYPNCPATCPTRMGDLKSAMGGFLTDPASAAIARVGLTFFPDIAGGQCKGASAVSVELPPQATIDDAAELRAKANEVNLKLQTLSPNGGTPTGASLSFLGTLPGLTDLNDARQDFVLLLTDGLPNCNDANPNHECAGPNASCNCTQLPVSSCLNPSLCAKGCLDRAGAVDAIKALGDEKIKVIVVGFGAETATGDAADTLNAMGEAGGFAPACPNRTQAECGAGNTCDTNSKLCTRKFYQANNASDLAAALAKISQIFGINPCEYTLLTQPSDPRFLAVIVNGVNQPRGPNTWDYSAGLITFTGAICDQIMAATPAAPVNVEVRIVQSL